MQRTLFDFQEILSCFKEKQYVTTRLLLPYIGGSNFVEDICPLLLKHFKNVGKYMSSTVKYFTMEQWIRYTMFRKNVFGSRAFEFFKMCDLPVFALPFANNLSFDITPELVGSTNNQFVSCIESGEIAGWFSRSSSALYRRLLNIKICSLPFFLHEALGVYNIKMPVPIRNNLFFENMSMFVCFLKDLNVEIPKIEKESFDDLEEDCVVDENFVLISRYTFYPYVLTNREQKVNALKVSNMSFDIKYTHCEQRTILFKDVEYYSDAYNFYMSRILNLVPRSLNSLKREMIKNQKANYFITEELVNFVRNESISFTNNTACYREKRIFFTFSTTDIQSAKNRARYLEIYEFYILRCDLIKIEKVTIRKTKPKNTVAVTY